MSLTERVRERTDRVRGRVERVQTRTDRLLEIGWIAHLQRTVQRYNGRLGYQFGAGVAFFSVLAVVPVVMVAFSVLGFFLVELRPDLITTVSAAVLAEVRGVDDSTLEDIRDVLLGLLRNYTSIGIVGLVAGLYSGATWLGHLRNAIDAQWRDDFDADRDLTPYPVKVAVNLVRMAGLLVLIAVTFGLAALSTNLVQEVAGWVGLADSWVTSTLLRVLAGLLSLTGGWVLFCYVFLVVPRQRRSWRYVRVGALVGAVGLAVLQYGTTVIIAALGGNRSVAVFGPVIVVMLFFNLFAQLILLVAAWVGTADEPAFRPPGEGVVRFALTPAPPTHPVAAAVVSERAAEQAVRVGLGAGWLTGAATGLGLGAVLALVAGLRSRGRRGAGRPGGRVSGRRPSR